MSFDPALPLLRHFSIDSLPREAWKNGRGWTRTLASHYQQGELCWRVSLADITAAGPFSRFDGVDRTAVMVCGTELNLVGETGTWHFNGPGSFARFPGEAALHCDAPREPTQLWNVMVRRGRSQADLLIAADEAVDLPCAPHVLVLAIGGRFKLTTTGTETLSLAAGDVLHLQGLTAWAQLAPCEASSLVLVTALR